MLAVLPRDKDDGRLLRELPIEADEYNRGYDDSGRGSRGKYEHRSRRWGFEGNHGDREGGDKYSGKEDDRPPFHSRDRGAPPQDDSDPKLQERRRGSSSRELPSNQHASKSGGEDNSKQPSGDFQQQPSPPSGHDKADQSNVTRGRDDQRRPSPSARYQGLSEARQRLREEPITPMVLLRNNMGGNGNDKSEKADESTLQTSGQVSKEADIAATNGMGTLSNVSISATSQLSKLEKVNGNSSGSIQPSHQAWKPTPPVKPISLASTSEEKPEKEEKTVPQHKQPIVDTSSTEAKQNETSSRTPPPPASSESSKTPFPPKSVEEIEQDKKDRAIEQQQNVLRQVAERRAATSSSGTDRRSNTGEKKSSRETSNEKGNTRSNTKKERKPSQKKDYKEGRGRTKSDDQRKKRQTSNAEFTGAQNERKAAPRVDPNDVTKKTLLFSDSTHNAADDVKLPSSDAASNVTDGVKAKSSGSETSLASPAVDKELKSTEQSSRPDDQRAKAASLSTTTRSKHTRNKDDEKKRKRVPRSRDTTERQEKPAKKRMEETRNRRKHEREVRKHEREDLKHHASNKSSSASQPSLPENDTNTTSEKSGGKPTTSEAKTNGQSDKTTTPKSTIEPAKPVASKPFVPAPPPAVSAWKSGPPPGIRQPAPSQVPVPTTALSVKPDASNDLESVKGVSQPTPSKPIQKVVPSISTSSPPTSQQTITTTHHKPRESASTSPPATTPIQERRPAPTPKPLPASVQTSPQKMSHQSSKAGSPQRFMDKSTLPPVGSTQLFPGNNAVFGGSEEATAIYDAWKPTPTIMHSVYIDPWKSNPFAPTATAPKVAVGGFGSIWSDAAPSTSAVNTNPHEAKSASNLTLPHVEGKENVASMTKALDNFPPTGNEANVTIVEKADSSPEPITEAVVLVEKDREPEEGESHENEKEVTDHKPLYQSRRPAPGRFGGRKSGGRFGGGRSYGRGSGSTYNGHSGGHKPSHRNLGGKKAHHKGKREEGSSLETPAEQAIVDGSVVVKEDNAAIESNTMIGQIETTVKEKPETGGKECISTEESKKTGHPQLGHDKRKTSKLPKKFSGKPGRKPGQGSKFESRKQSNGGRTHFAKKHAGRGGNKTHGTQAESKNASNNEPAALKEADS